MTPRYQGAAYKHGEVIAQIGTVDVVRNPDGTIFAYVESWRAYTSAGAHNLQQWVSNEELLQIVCASRRVCPSRRST
jgi:hypothetical protein